MGLSVELLPATGVCSKYEATQITRWRGSDGRDDPGARRGAAGADWRSGAGRLSAAGGARGRATGAGARDVSLDGVRPYLRYAPVQPAAAGARGDLRALLRPGGVAGRLRPGPPEGRLAPGDPSRWPRLHRPPPARRRRRSP